MSTAKELLSQNTIELIKKLQKRYQIGQTQVYRRLKHLKIESQKSRQEGAWLTCDQLQQLDELHEHLQTGKPMETYKITAIEQKLELMGDNVLVHQSSELTQTATTSELSPEIIHANQTIANEQAIAELQRVAQEKAAANLILTNLLAGEYQKRPELLDLDLQKAVTASEVAATPKPLNPNAYAQEMLKRLSIG